MKIEGKIINERIYSMNVIFRFCSVLYFCAFALYANGIEINGINYILNKGSKTASVINDKYTGIVQIPPVVKYNGDSYSVTEIADGAFVFSDISSVTIPNSVTCIGKDAFYGCYSLTSITIPNSVTSIGEEAFGYLINIIYSGSASGKPWGAKCVNGYKEGDLVFRDASKKELLGCYHNAEHHINIPPSVTTIGDHAFSNCIWIRSINIPNSVIFIGKGAFFNCASLTSINIPNGLTSIKDDTFAFCKSLTSLTLPNSIMSIGFGAFWGCLALSSVSIPNGITSIQGNTFLNCESLKFVTIPNGVISIGKDAFRNCHNLTSVTIPNSVTTIREDAFAKCTSLKEFHYSQGLDISKANIPSTTKLIAYTPTNLSKSSTTTISSTHASSTNNTSTVAAKSTTQQSAASTQHTTPTTPMPTSLPSCYILSSKKGDTTTYSSDKITLCYYVSNLSEGQTVKFYVNDVEQTIISNGQKGAHVVNGIEVGLRMPQKNGEKSVVSVRIKDANGITWCEDQRTYVYESKHKPTLHVFATGLNTYNVENFANLKFAEKDARDFVRTIVELADKKMYQKVDTTLILGREANRDNLLDQLQQLERRVDRNDVVMIFFSGHGMTENGKSYFLTSNAKKVIQGLPTREITDEIQTMKSRNCNVFVFMDACHSGAMNTDAKGYTKPITVAEKEVVGYYSCTENQLSLEKPGFNNGIFTYALKKGLKGEADNNGDGEITIYELDKYIRDWVRKETNGNQSPTLDYKGNDYILFYKKK